MQLELHQCDGVGTQRRRGNHVANVLGDLFCAGWLRTSELVPTDDRHSHAHRERSNDVQPYPDAAEFLGKLKILYR